MDSQNFTPQELNNLHSQLTVLAAASPDGVTLDKLRVFYPRAGWDWINGGVRQLEAAGRLTTKAITNASNVPILHIFVVASPAAVPPVVSPNQS